MTVTASLLDLYHIDCQILGLSARLRSAERFLAHQEGVLSDLEAERARVEREVMQVRASEANIENEVAVLESRIASARERMNSARTNKEYKALLLEVNSLKDAKSAQETEAIGLLERIEALRAQQEEIERKIEEQRRVVEVARAQREEQEAAVRDRLEELNAQRQSLAERVAPEALREYTTLFERRQDEAMAPVQELDRKRHEFACGGCMMALPLDLITSLFSQGDLTRCVSCGAILYLEEKVAEAIQPRKR